MVLTAIIFVYNYLSSRKQRSKISDIYSSRQEILSGLPQGQYLDRCCLTLVYAICFSCNIAIYADGNTPYLSGKNVEEILNSLENLSSNLLQTERKCIQMPFTKK